MADGGTAVTDGQGGDRRRGIDRVIILLEALRRHRSPMKAGDIARLIGAPRSTTYEIVNRLIAAEMLETVGNDGHVYFGRAMHLYGWAYSHHNAHYRRIVEALDRLSAEAQATAQVCALHGNKYVVLDSRDGPGPFRITSDIGAEVPIPWTASGRLLLGHLSDAEILDFIPAEDFLLPGGRALSPASFLDDIAKARRDGYSETTGLADRFTWCMAAPIRDARGAIGKTLCLVLPVETPPPHRHELLRSLLKTSAALSLDHG